MIKQRPRHARVLTNIRVDEISCVDKGAGEGVKIVMMKRDGKPDYEAFFGRIFGVEKKERDDEAARLAAEMHTDADRDDDDDTFLAADTGESGSGSVDQLERARRAMKMENTMTREQELSNFCKRHGIAAVARSVNEKGAFLTEAEYSKLLSEDCARTGRDFSKAIEGGSASDPDTIEIAKAWRRCSDAGFASRQATVGKAAGSSAPSTPHFLADGSVPTMSPGRASLKPRSSGVSGKPAQQGVNNPRLSIAQLQALIDAQRAEADDESGGEAYEKLCKLAADMHAERPDLTFEKCFEKVYTSPANREIAKAERIANRPVATWG